MLQPLPIVERWDCHQCGLCCRQTAIPLDANDLVRIRSQRWEEQPDFRGVQTIVKHGMIRPIYRLAKQADGACVFLTAEGRCRVHELHGSEGKPRVCQMYPLQPVSIGGKTLVTLRRSCPSAAGDQGRPVADHLAALEPLVLPLPLGEGRSEGTPPRIMRGFARPWPDVHQAAAAFQCLLTDSRYPLVRRWIHALDLCRLLEDCRLSKLRAMDGKALAELIHVLERTAIRESGQWFAEREQPSGSTAVLFRQTAGDFLGLHPRTVHQAGFLHRLKLAKAAWNLARGNGDLPALVQGYATTGVTFANLERPARRAGSRRDGAARQLFPASARLPRYAMLGYRHWPLVEGLRAAALSYAVALWMLRWSAASSGPPQRKEMIPIIAALDRSLGYATLNSARHRRRVSLIARGGALERLVVWYAR